MSDAVHMWIPYCGPGSEPSDWLSRWNFDPVLLVTMTALLMLGVSRHRATTRLQIGSAFVIAILFVSPLCALGSALFAVRAGHHLALGYILAPLLATAIGAQARGRTMPLGLATVLQAAVLWVWHLPSLYEAAFRSELVFWAMQLSITGSAVVWWIALRAATWPAVTASLLGSMVQMGLLGALIVFAGQPLYAPHWLTTNAWGLTPIEDQQIAGLLMWIGGGGICLMLAAVLLYRGLSSPGPRLSAA